MRTIKKLYLERAAELSKDDMNLWIRYLNKSLLKITDSVKDTLFNSEYLTKEQKKVLKEVLTEGSYLNTKTRSLSLDKRVQRKVESSTKVADEAFELLNSKLKENNLTLEIVCAGGFVLQTLGIRATMDVDAFFTASSRVNAIIHSVGEELGINEEDESWLNNSIANMNNPPKNKYKELYKSYSNLTVYKVKPDYLIGMKLMSGREKDLEDVSLLLRKLSLEDPFTLFKSLKKMGFNRLDFADLLGCFGNAYGNRWLANLYKERGEEIFSMM